MELMAIDIKDTLEGSLYGEGGDDTLQGGSLATRFIGALETPFILTFIYIFYNSSGNHSVEGIKKRIFTFSKK
jgi:Ca2+-binding RTX toxin-like protein